MSVWTDDRGLANRLIGFGLVLITGSLLIAIGQQFLPNLMTRASNATTEPAGTTGIQYMQTYWNWWPLVVIGIGAVMVIAGAAYESRRPGV